MANITPVPVLGSQGWVTDPSNKLDYVLSHLFLTDPNQTYVYYQNIFSIQSIWQKTGGEVYDTANALQLALTNYLQKYYREAEVTVTIKEPDADLNNGQYTIILNLGLYDGETVGDHVRLLNMSGGKLENIIRVNNDGQ